MPQLLPPFVLSLSMHRPFLWLAGFEKERPFDRLRANGVGGQ